jgi:DnaJ-class molecular chaperone
VAEALAQWQQRPDDPLRWLREYESGRASAGAGDGFASVRRILLLPPKVRAAYATLGLRPGAAAEEVTARRRALAREHHPDVGGDARAMVAINAATDTLLAWLRREEAPVAAGG